MSHVDVLPTEMVQRIIRLLPNQDLSSVVLVCRRWREIGEDPSMWTWYWDQWESGVPVYRGDLKMLNIRRLKHVQEIEVVGAGVDTFSEHMPGGDWESLELETLFWVVMRLSKLTHLYMDEVNLSSVEPGVLATAVNKMEKVSMEACQLTSQQVDTIFGTISVSTKLKYLKLTDNNLDMVDPTAMATAVNMMEDVYMGSCQLTSKQLNTLFGTINESTKLKSLDLSANNLSTVDPTTLAPAVNMLEGACLVYTWLTEEQLTCILRHAALETNLDTLYLDRYNNRHVDQNIIEAARKKIGILVGMKC